MRIIRSAVLLYVGLLVAAPAAGQENFVPDPAVPDADATCKPLPEIHTRRSTGGLLLQDELTMAPDTFSVGNTHLRRNVYNGRYNATLYRLNPGDSVNWLVRNRMQPVPQADPSKVANTNQHFHGFVVTPLPTAGDNVVPVSIPNPGQNRNSFHVPEDQSPGLMWYHPHPHGSTSAQVNGGLAGAMIVGNLLDAYFPQYKWAGGNSERVMYIKDTKDDSGTPMLNILGNTCTVIEIRPWEMQFWRIANMSANTFVNLKLDGRQFTVLAWDGNPVMREMTEDSLFISPGSRVEVIVTGWWPDSPADSARQLFSAAFQRDQKSRTERINLGWVVSRGIGVGRPAARRPTVRLLGANAALRDSIANLVDEPDVNRDTIRFQSSGGLKLNGASYHHDSLSTAVPHGQVQEWTLINETLLLHTFHIHQTDFVVTHINGVAQPDSVHLDNVFLGIHQRNPPHDTIWVGDTVVVRFQYRPIAVGPFVYHCHVLSHEDAGMMANMCVYDRDSGVTYCDEWFEKGPWGSKRPNAALPTAPPVGAGAHAHGAGGDGGGRER